MNAIENYVLPEGRSLGLKGVLPGGVPESVLNPGFRWNLTPGNETEAPDWTPEAPDWNSEPEDGGGLHLWAWGQGDARTSNIWYTPYDKVWVAVEYETSSAVGLTGKIKVPKCKTIAVSLNRKEVISFIQERTPEEKQGSAVDVNVVEVEEGDAEVGDFGIAIARGKGTAIAGFYGIAMVGDGGKAEAGSGGTAIAGDGGTASAGRYGKAYAGDGGKARVGDKGTAHAGEGGIAEAGDDGGSAFAGDYGTASVGWEGYAWVGKGGKAKVGKGGRLYLQNSQGWIQLSEGSNIKPDTFYKLDDLGNPVEVGE